MANAFVQSGSTLINPNAIPSNPTVTLTLTAGNLLIVAGGYGFLSADPFVSLTSSPANTFTQIGTTLLDTVSLQRGRLYYAKNIAGGSTTITLDVNAGNNALSEAWIIAHEVSGADLTSPLDGNNGQWQSSPGTATDAITSGTFTPANNGCYIFGVVQQYDANSNQISPGTDFTGRQNVATAFAVALRSEDRIQSTAAAAAATFTTLLDQNMITFGAAFKPAAGGPTAAQYAPAAVQLAGAPSAVIVNG
jgi:hypothetical protein